MSNTVGLSSPWAIYFKQISALFEKDPEVSLTFDSEEYKISLYVDNDIKADAIRKLLPEEKDFGNVKITIEVIPANDEEESRASLFKRAFNGNPAVFDILSAGPLGYDFVIFEKEVVQYYNDDLTDAYGYCSTLYQDIAKEVFGEDGKLFFSTHVDAEE